MKQILSVADLATMLDLVNDEIHKKRSMTYYVCSTEYLGTFKERKKTEKEIEKERNTQIEKMNNDPFYQSLLHLKQALENLNVEIETPELKVEGETK